MANYSFLNVFKKKKTSKNVVKLFDHISEIKNKNEQLNLLNLLKKIVESKTNLSTNQIYHRTVYRFLDFKTLIKP